MSSAPSARARVKRLPDRARYELNVIEDILDEALICHVGFVVDGQLYVIPTIHARDGDRLYLHGSAASRMLRTLNGGIQACVTASIVDGLVLARSAFHHSVNYRSVVVLVRAFEVEDEGEKVRALRAVVEHVAPGRWDEVRGPTPSELRQTTVLRMGLEEASAKVRSGPPKDDERDLDLPIWAGDLPMRLAALEARDDPLLGPGIRRPGWLATYDRRARTVDGVGSRTVDQGPISPHFDYDGLIVDLDGVVWLGGEPIEGVADAIAVLRAMGTRVLFVTNDPQSSRDEQAARLSAIGIPATAEDVMTAATATARFLGSQQHLRGRSAYVIGSRALRDEVEQAGLRLVPAADARLADVVVVGGHDGFDYEDLRAATTAVGKGATLYATGRDAVFPAHDGPRPATGAILAAVEVATGATATVVGKPGPFMFEMARDALAGCRRVAVIGDHLISDIAGAKRAGLDAILVLTGTATRNDLEKAVIQPDLVLPSLAALTGSVPEPTPPGGRARR